MEDKVTITAKQLNLLIDLTGDFGWLHFPELYWTMEALNFFIANGTPLRDWTNQGLDPEGKLYPPLPVVATPRDYLSDALVQKLIDAGLYEPGFDEETEKKLREELHTFPSDSEVEKLYKDLCKGILARNKREVKCRSRACEPERSPARALRLHRCT
jgi:hypothetical protein